MSTRPPAGAPGAATSASARSTPHRPRDLVLRFGEFLDDAECFTGNEGAAAVELGFDETPFARRIVMRLVVPDALDVAGADQLCVDLLDPFGLLRRPRGTDLRLRSDAIFDP